MPCKIIDTRDSAFELSSKESEGRIMTGQSKNLVSRILALVCWLTFLSTLGGCAYGPENNKEGQPAKPARPFITSTTILAAAADGNTTRVRELLDQGVSANTLGRDHNTPIMEAAYAGHLDTVKLLLDRGADLSVIKIDGATPMALAGNHKEVIDLFKDVTALVEAASKGDNRTVSELISKGTPVNGLDQYGHTALTEASWNGFTETVKFLLDHGADPRIKKSDGATPLDLANGRKQQAIVVLLTQANARLAAGSPATSPK